jgi:AAA-like domain/Bacterial regulatory proteins, luxR family
MMLIDRDKFEKVISEISTKKKNILFKLLNNEKDADIASNLGISEGTVRTHVSQICKALELDDSSGERRSMRAELLLICNHYIHILKQNIDSDLIISKPKIYNPDNSYYVERPPFESDCYREITYPGALIRIKSPKGTGKTCLANKIINHAKTINYEVALVNFLSASESDFQTLDKFLCWFCMNVADALNKDIVEWDDRIEISVTTKCTKYFKRILSEVKNSPLLICLDNVDKLLRPESEYKSIAADFFSLLRSWNERAAATEIWQNLRLIIVHSTEVYGLFLDIKSSPFNVGTVISLPNFNFKQVQELMQKYELELNKEEIEELIDFLGGNPSLLNKAFRYLKSHPNIQLNKFLETARTEEGEYRQLLEDYLSIFQEDPEVNDYMEIIVTQNYGELVEIESETQSRASFKLDSMGLILRDKNKVKISCKLFYDYLKCRLLNIKKSETKI